ncbi:MAG TPA: phage tail protein, partial [Streptosporangiaceae bacterium]
MTENPPLDPGSSLYFSLTIDGQDMGLFNGCEGLALEVEVEEYPEGGNNGYMTRLPGRIKHSTLRLTRPLTPDSAKLTSWISSITTGVQRPTVQIAALRADGSQVAQWGLLEALPSSWTGPTLDPSSNTVATETLEIVFHGFIDAGA